MDKQKCVLIYDDDLEILALCKMILEKDNYKVETCKICDNIINDIKAFKPDIVLMDLWIPKMGGEEAVKLLREHEKFKDIPVLFFSANDEIKNISKATNADGYIQKPFDLSVFREKIKTCVERN